MLRYLFFMCVFSPQLVKLCSGMIEAGKVYVSANKLFVNGIRDLSQQCKKDEMITVRFYRQRCFPSPPFDPSDFSIAFLSPFAFFLGSCSVCPQRALALMLCFCLKKAGYSQISQGGLYTGSILGLETSGSTHSTCFLDYSYGC